MYRKLECGWVFDSADEEKVASIESDEAMILRAAAHVRKCCLSGHDCRRGDRCREKCESCHRDTMAVWGGKKRDLDQQANAFLARADGVPMYEEIDRGSLSVEEVAERVFLVLEKLGIIFP